MNIKTVVTSKTEVYGNDGVHHINVNNSKAKTKFGKFMSDWARTPISTEDGDFESIEGYKYWLKNGNEAFRYLHGWDVIKLGGRCYVIPDEDEADKYYAKIKQAYLSKLEKNPLMAIKFYNCDLPLYNYYYHKHGGLLHVKPLQLINLLYQIKTEPITNLKGMAAAFSRRPDIFAKKPSTYLFN